MKERLIGRLRSARLCFSDPLVSDLGWALFLGSVIRLVLMPFVAHPFDMYAWYTYCSGVLEHGFDVGEVLSSVRPLWFLTLTSVAYLYGLLSPIAGSRAVPVEELPDLLNPHYGARFVPDPLFNVLVKAPMLMADVAVAVVLYWVVMQFWGREKARNASLLFYLNPVGIWISAAWGQYESVPALLTVISLYLLMKGKIISSAISLLTATLYKVYPAVFLVPVSVYLVKRVGGKSLLKYHMAFFTPMLLFLSVGGLELVNHYSGLISSFFSARTFFGVFGFGLTYWSISLLWPLDSHVWAPLSSLLVAILVSISLYLVLKARFVEPFRGLVVGTFLMIAAVFLSYRFIGETRFAWSLPFLSLMTVDGVISRRLYGLLSLTAFLYAQKNFPYYLLPMATVKQEVLNHLFELATPFGKVVDGALLPTSVSAAALAILGTVFSALMLAAYLKGIRESF